MFFMIALFSLLKRMQGQKWQPLINAGCYTLIVPLYFVLNYYLLFDFPGQCDSHRSAVIYFGDGWNGLFVSLTAIPGLMFVLSTVEQYLYYRQIKTILCLCLDWLGFFVMIVTLFIVSSSFSQAGCLSGPTKNTTILTLLSGNWILSILCSTASLIMSAALAPGASRSRRQSYELKSYPSSILNSEYEDV